MLCTLLIIKLLVAPLLGAGIIAGASLLGAGGGVYAAGKMNKKTREWNEKMYGIQRADALKDWNMQNEYNSLENQMARLKAAGLNPNLVYDNGATQQAAAVRSTDVKSWSPNTPDFSGVGSAAAQGVQAYQDITLQQEQVKNMEAQRNNMVLDSVLKGIQAAAGGINNAKSQLELDKSRALFDTSISTAEAQLRAIDTATDIKVSREVRDAAMHAPNLAAAFEKVANMRTDGDRMRAQIKDLEKSGVLKSLEINMRKLGMTYNDNILLRMLSQFADGKSLPEVVKQLSGKVQSMLGEMAPSMPKFTDLDAKEAVDRFNRWKKEKYH